MLASLDPSPSSFELTLAFVEERLTRVEGVLKLAISGVEGLLSAAFAVAGHVPHADSPRTAAMARRLDATSLPVVADYVQLVRSLVLVSVYEARLAPVEVGDGPL
jgi:hypothetical protein